MKPPTASAFRQEVDEIRENYMVVPDETVKQVKTWASQLYQIDKAELVPNEDARKHGQRLVNDLLADFHFRPKLLDLIDESPSASRLQEELFSLSREIRDATGTEDRRSTMPVREFTKQTKPPVVIKCGVPVFDQLVGGGFRPTETTIILGPTSGGKTLAAMQVGVKFSMFEPVYFATYEESAKKLVDPDRPEKGMYSPFSLRAAGPAFGISREELQAVDYDVSKLPRAKREDIERIQSGPMGVNFKVEDYKQRTGAGASVSGLIHDIRREVEERGIKMAIVDPFWPLCLKTASTRGASLDPQILRNEAVNIIEQLHEAAEQLHIILLITHQLGASAAQKTAKTLDVYGAAEVRTMAWRPENTIIVSKADHSGNCYLILGKGRNCGKKGSKILVKLDGNKNQFVPPDDQEESSVYEAPVDRSPIDQSTDYDNRVQQIVDAATRAPGEEEDDAE